MNTLDHIKELAGSDNNQYLAKAKDQGKKIIGYFCSFVPEELITAAGAVPFRMRAVNSTGTTQGDTFYGALNCSFVRHCFDKALRGEFRFLDGVIFANGCDHSRRMYDNWRKARDEDGVGPDFLHLVAAPHTTDELARKWYTEELTLAKKALEDNLGVSITEDSLGKAIALSNRKRQLLAQLYKMRTQPCPPITGSETLAVLLAITAMPVESACDLIESLIKEISDRKTGTKDDIRVFLAGGCVEDVAFLEMIEENRAVIVADSLCLGARHFKEPVSSDGEPLASLAKQCLSHLSCPRMVDHFQDRSALVRKIIKDAKADAVITQKLMFCDLWGGETYLMRQEAKQWDVPFLGLERELYGGGQGQLATRVQAFFEMVANRSGKAV